MYRVTLSLLVLALGCVAQNSKSVEPTCKALDSSKVSHHDGVEIRIVRFLDTRQPNSPKEVTAHVYIPDSENPVPGIIFSHSSIQADDQLTDLKPFANALARGGIASIMLDRTITWKPLNDEANRDVSVGSCAAVWLLDNALLDKGRLMNGGLLMFNACAPKALNGNRWCVKAIVNFGYTTNAEYRNTESMRTLTGQIRLARFVTRHFKLPEIKPEWLGDTAVNTLFAAK